MTCLNYASIFGVDARVLRFYVNMKLLRNKKVLSAITSRSRTPSIPIVATQSLFRLANYIPQSPRNLNRPANTQNQFHTLAVLKMKEAIVNPDLSVVINDVSIPKATASQVLIKVIVTGSNPKDWKRPKLRKLAHNPGDDIAGIVEAVGDDVLEFKKGDRVASFHEMLTAHGSFAEYAIGESHTTFHIPENTSFEEASTIPLAAMTAAFGLYIGLKLPEPWQQTKSKTPLIVYGGASAVGAFVLKLAAHSNIHPLIVVAGSSIDFVEKLIDRSKGDAIVDYRNGDEAIVSGIKSALLEAGTPNVLHAFDATSEKGSYQNLSKVLGKGAIFTTILPLQDFTPPEGISHKLTMVGAAHMVETEDFAYTFFRLFGRGLEKGWFTPHPYEVIPGGLGGLEEGLKKLEAGKARAVKYVYRVAETEGVESA